MSYDDCVCDYYESPTVYSLTKPVARQVHKCTECGRAINPGDQYEKVFGVWDGDAGTHKTCARCVAMREWVKAHVPCLCWAHGNMRNDVIQTARSYAHEAPGLLFGMWRRYATPRNRLEQA